MREALSPAEQRRLAKAPQTSYGPWSNTELLLATLADRLAWVIYAVYASQGGKPKKPEPIPRPGVPLRSANKALDERQIALLEAQRAKNREAVGGR